MKTKKILIFSKILLISTLILPFSVFADNTTTTSPSNLASTTQPSVLGLQAPPVPPLIVAIKQAKMDLAAIKLEYKLNPVYKNVKNKKTGKSTKALTGYTLSSKEIALGILDPATGQVGVVKGLQSGKKITFNDPNFDPKLKNFNGVNSSFTVSKPAGGIVVALKYLITGPEKGSKTSIENALREAVYVPYSDNLNAADVVNYGADYLDNIFSQVVAELQGLPSHAIPGQTITQAIRPALVQALVYAEHTDTASLLASINPQDTINRLNTLFAVNEGDTFNYSVSTAGARGLAQFMPSTYKGLVQRHPESGLISDFAAGMNDHKNAIKAMYLLLDDYTGAVRVKAQTGFASGMAFDYGAASYNGGVARVAKAVENLGVNWNQDQSGQVNSLQSQVNSLTGQIRSLKSQIKKAPDKKTKASLQSQLNSASSHLSSASSQLKDVKASSLRNETVNYLKKIYKVIPLFNS